MSKESESLKPTKLAVFSNNILRNYGESRIMEAVLLRLARRGYDIHLFTSRLDSPLADAAGVTVHQVKIFSWKNATMFLQFGLVAPFYYWQTRRRQDFEGVIGCGLTNLWLRQDLSICAFCHSSWRRMERQELAGRSGRNWRSLLQSWFSSYLILIERYVWPRLVGKVLAISEFTRQNLIEDADYVPEKVGVLTVGVDSAEFKPVASKQARIQLRQHLGLPLDEDKLYLVFVGDLTSRRKGFHHVLNALHQLADKRLHLIVAGATEDNLYAAQVKDLGLAAQVSFLGVQQQIAQVYGAGDLFVFPSQYDPWGLVVGEAMACGLPVITTASCGASQMVVEGVNGLVIEDAANIAALKQAILTLTSSSQKRVEWGAAARRTAEEYSWERVVDRFEEELRLVVLRRAGSSTD